MKSNSGRSRQRTLVLTLGYQPDKLTDFLETVRQRCRFSQWFCGHYHINQVIDERFVIQWEQISKIEAASI
ncbi:MAG: hypothetical protein K2M42_06245 [Oscillospiraceae bacterium]|nr:hypothetical protein [Oscillospiraceae bacterium]